MSQHRTIRYARFYVGVSRGKVYPFRNVSTFLGDKLLGICVGRLVAFLQGLRTISVFPRCGNFGGAVERAGSVLPPPSGFVTKDAYFSAIKYARYVWCSSASHRFACGCNVESMSNCASV